MKRKIHSNERIYTTHGIPMLLAVKGKVDGVVSMVYMKDGKMIGYSSMEEIICQMSTGPYIEFNTMA